MAESTSSMSHSQSLNVTNSHNHILDEKPSSFEGYLSKGGKNLLIQYPKRYFRVLGGALFWYKSKDDTNPLGDILINDGISIFYFIDC